jgi:hypothetical protein
MKNGEDPSNVAKADKTAPESGRRLLQLISGYEWVYLNLPELGVTFDKRFE